MRARNFDKEILIAEQLESYEFETMKDLEREVTRLHIKNKYRLGDLGKFQTKLTKGYYLEYKYYLGELITDIYVIPRNNGYKVTNVIMIHKEVLDSTVKYLKSL